MYFECHNSVQNMRINNCSNSEIHVRFYLMEKSYKFHVKIYYEDTDAGGVVYYANYLKFTERARSEMIYKVLGLKHKDLKEKFNVIFVVTAINAKYIKSAKFEDNITVITNILKSSAVRLTLKQDIKIKDKLLFTSEVELAVVKENGSVQKLPKELLSKIN